ncbi:hypothetical protein QUF78_17710 [Peribacillus sp. ACCC06369]|nr:hypothetical protein [Peribacillus sp. ACCC06369]
MANMKVVFITSVSIMTYNQGPAGLSYAYSYVHDLADTVANDYIAKGWAIPFVGWETNPKRPVNVKFPQ